MKFYSLTVDGGRKKRFAYMISISGLKQQSIKCTKCKREWANFELEDDASFALSYDYFADFTSFMFYKLVSKKTYRILTSQTTLSSTFRKVRMISKESLPKETLKELRSEGENVSKFSVTPQPYYLINVKKGAKLHTKTKLQIERCSACGYEAPITPGMIYFDSDQPIYIDIASWDGSDLFTVEHFPAKLYCSEKFYTIYQKNQLTGLIFEEVEAI